MQATDKAVDGLQLFGKAVSDLQCHVETLKEANKQDEALDASELVSQAFCMTVDSGV